MKFDQNHLDYLRMLHDRASPGDWEPGHLSDDTHSCNCRYVFDEGHAGAITTVHVDDGQGNHAPSLEEAKANMVFIAAAKTNMTGLLDLIAEQQANVQRLRQALIAAGNSVGAFLTKQCSTDFLMGVPNEIEAYVERVRQDIADQSS